MLYPTLNQGLVFLYLFCAGFACGFLFDFARLFLIFCNQNKVAKHIFYFFATAVTCLTLYFVNLYTNFGQFRIFVMFAFALALAFQQFCVGIPLSKLTNRIRTAYKNKLAAKNTAANDNNTAKTE